jgi:hypothetical protein
LTVDGYSERHARRLLQDAMERAGRMTEDERQRFRMLALPPAEGSRKRRALELRAAGMPYQDIGDELGIDRTTAAHYVAEALERFLGEEVRCADAARQLHLARLEDLLSVRWDKAMRGDATAAMACLKILERQAKLLGLDAPQRVDIAPRLRLLAEQEGLDPDEVIAEARAIIKRLPK